MTSISTHRLIVSFACACTTSSFLTANDATLGIIICKKRACVCVCVCVCLSLLCDQKKSFVYFLFTFLFAAQNQTFSLYFNNNNNNNNNNGTASNHSAICDKKESFFSFFRTTNRVNSWRSRRRRDWQRVFVSTDGIARFGRQNRRRVHRKLPKRNQI